ncbi:hypothetical protein TorRG33x02_144370 [Trema orientale]|uniref:Uncharacterized protein n=1 Tax=Trema orientale TaxID=63057 RepID=A0A2P5EW41_TREOI|nr:hypothetical protein TorRG33x02_144370 [Trema orientale]
MEDTYQEEFGAMRDYESVLDREVEMQCYDFDKCGKEFTQFTENQQMSFPTLVESTEVEESNLSRDAKEAVR